MRATLEFRYVDVFADTPFSGSGLMVLFGSTASAGARALISVTAEMRQFELILVDSQPESARVGAGIRVAARIFTPQEELPFAGHPVLGAAAALHERYAGDEAGQSWLFVIAGREIAVRSRRTDGYYEAEMNQGPAALATPLGDRDAARLAAALGLGAGDLHRLPMQVASPGLPYLIVPVSEALSRARIAVDDFGAQLASV